MSGRYGAWVGTGCLMVAVVGVGELVTLGGGLRPPVPRETKLSQRPASQRAPITVDLGSIARRAHHAFHREDGGSDRLAADQGTYRVVADGTIGQVEIAPVGPGGAAKASGARRAGAPLLLRTAFVGREGSSASAGPAVRTVDEAGDLNIEHGNILERWQNRDAGTEVSWQWSSRPAGSGDLVVHLSIGGENHAGASERGEHFVDRETGMGMRVGRASWVDASGDSWPIDTLYLADHRTIEWRVPRARVDASTYPARIDPVISPEFGTDLPIAGAASDTQSAPSVAGDMGQFLAVWSDSASLATGTIRGARLKAPLVLSGTTTLLDPGGFDIHVPGASETVGLFSLTATAFAGNGHYLVAWQRGPLVGAADVSAGALPDGGSSVIVGSALEVSTQADTGCAAACGGGACWVAWNGAGHVHARRFDLAPSPALGPEIDLGDASPASGPALTFGANEFLAVWIGSGGNVVGAFFDAMAGSVVPLPSVAATSPLHPAVSSDDEQFLIAWEQTGPGGDSDVYGAFAAPGNAAPLSPFLVSRISSNDNGAAPFDQTRPAVVSAASHQFVVTWEDRRTGQSADLYGTVVSQPLQPKLNIVALSADTQHDELAPTMTCDNVTCFLAWMRDNVASDILGSRMSAAQPLPSTTPLLDGTSFVVATGANPETHGVVASDGTDFLLAWDDTRNTTSLHEAHVYGAIVRSDATVATPNGVAVAVGAGTQHVGDVRFDGKDYLVVYNQATGDVDNGMGTYDILGRKVGRDGSPGANITLQAGVGTPALPRLAYRTGEAAPLVVWIAAGVGVRGGFVEPSGSVMLVGSGDPPLVVDDPQAVQATVVAMKSGFALAWESQSCTRATCTCDVLTQRLGVDGALTGDVLSDETISCDVSELDLASDGDSFVLALATVPSFGSISHSFASLRQVLSDGGGSVEPVFPVSDLDDAGIPSVGGPTVPRITYDGFRYLVVAGLQAVVPGDQGSVVGRYFDDLTSQGPILTLASSKAVLNTAGLAPDQRGRVAVAFSRFEDAPLRAERIHGVLVSQAKALGESCTAAADCVSKVCQGQECSVACTSDADCPSIQNCSQGFCKSNLGAAASCQADRQCSSGHCADGLCCDTSCTGTCEACDVASLEGKCSPVHGAPHGGRPACEVLDPNNPCQVKHCSGQNPAACDGLVADEVTCVSGSCKGGVQTLPSRCDGNGACTAAVTKPCEPFSCGPDSCRSDCASADDCAPGYSCDSATRKCVSGGRCDGDHTLIDSADPSKTADCSPFKCDPKGCKTVCVSVDDCVAPSVCDEGGHCMAFAKGSSSGDCSCATPGSAPGGRPGMAAAGCLALVLLVRRRRRHGARSADIEINRVTSTKETQSLPIASLAPPS